MGSPDFSLPVLRALALHYQVVGVVTQPDRPAGRGRQSTPPPVKTLALQLGLEIIQPERLRLPDAQEKLHGWAPDLIVVAAFGQILRQNVLDLPRYGCINVHASLLPRWRGAAPIQAAILHGDAVTGATIMKMDAGIDTGPTLSRQAVEILPGDTAGSPFSRPAPAGGGFVMRPPPAYLAGGSLPTPQDETRATYAPMLKKEEGLLDFTQPAPDLADRVRAFNPWPGAFHLWEGQPLKIHRAHPLPDPTAQSAQRTVVEGLPAVGAAGGWLLLDEVQPAGKRVMSGKEFLAGARHWRT